MLYIISLFIISANAAFDHEIHTKYASLPRGEFIEYFNGLNLTWKIKEHDEEIIHHNCSFVDSNITYPIHMHELTSLSLPENFDAREKWPQCASISTIYEQGLCGSCWTFGTATTASDRTCIHANINVNLSEQDLGCCTNCFQTNACKGGHPEQAFQFWINSGLVTYDCLPYDINSLGSNTACTKSCVNGQDYNSVKNYGGNVYQVPADEEQIKAELYNNGPIEASLFVFADLLDYSHGVYVHTYGEPKDWHSVRIIGYGVENNANYWLVANSWGTNRGERGFYKIQRNQPDIHIEESLLTGKPKGY